MSLKKIVNRIGMFIVAMTFLTACTSVKTQVVDMECGPWIFGIAKASSSDKQFVPEGWALDAKTECLKTGYAKKFDEYDPPVDDKFVYRMQETSEQRRAVRDVLTLQSGGRAERTDGEHKIPKEVFQSKLRSAHYDFEFDANSKWEAGASPSPLYQVFAKNREGQAALFISVYDANPFLIWSDSRDSMYVRLRDELAYSDITRINETTFQNFEGFQVEIRGRDKNAAPLHYLSTQIRIGKKVLYLTTWCFEEDYEKNEQEFHMIANSLRMQPRFLTSLNGE